MNEYITIQKTDIYGRAWYLQRMCPALWTKKKENAHKYGFIERFPEGKEDITGFKYSFSHYRYVGVEAATYIHDNNITFEEYYGYKF